MINNLLDEGSFRRWDDGTPEPVITGEASSTPSSPPETSRALALLPADRVIAARAPGWPRGRGGSGSCRPLLL